MTEENKINNDDLSVLPEGFLVLDDSGSMFQVTSGELKPFSPTSVEKRNSVNNYSNNQELLDTGMEEPMLQPPPLAVMKKSASFYFHPDDEEEVGLINGKNVEQPNIRQFSVQKIVDKAISNFGLNFNNEEKKKFNQLMIAVMRDRRSIAETEKLLVDSAEGLGMGLPATLAGGIMTFISQVKQKITTEGGLVVDEEQIKTEPIVKPQTSPNEVPSASADTVQPKKKTSVVEEIARQVREEMAKNGIQQPVSQKQIPKSQPAGDFGLNQTKEDNVNSNVNVSMPDAVESQSFSTVKKVINTKPMPVPQNLSRFVNQSKSAFHDIKMDNRSLGPIDELALMNVATFRRLSPDLSIACQKIGAIINSLGKQSLARKTLGIKAWRSSPLYKQYLLVGRTSMETGKSIPDVINELISAQGDGLSVGEFEAVSDINRLIRL